MARYIDVDKIPYVESGDKCLYDCVYRDDINEIPTADVVEVVRCKDCVHYCSFEHCSNGICDVVVSAKRATYPTDFCSYGERKE